MGALGGVILCGGRSSRMGTPKAWLELGGETLLARTVRVVGSVAEPVVVAAAPGQELPALPNGVAVVRDAAVGNGPLQGIAAGLAAIAAHAPAAFVCGTDAPFLHPALIRRLAALHGGDHVIVVARAGGRVHPLAAVYGTAVLPAIAEALAAGRLRLTAIFDRVPTLIADEALLLAGDELRAADPDLRALSNVNTPEEYAAALAGAERDGPECGRRSTPRSG
jgi:molybdopterin-guanine dinucleotide biosynthesis protein A